MAICSVSHIHALLSALVLVRGVTCLVDHGVPKICNTVNCPNKHIEVADEIAGTIHRYSNNAANFLEAKTQSSSPSKGMNLRGHVNQENPDAVEATKKQHTGTPKGHSFHHKSNVSVLRDGRRSNQQFQMQHQQYFSESSPETSPKSHQVQQQKQQHHHQQQQQKKHQRHWENLQTSTTSRDASQKHPVFAKRSFLNAVGSTHAVNDGMIWSATIEGAIPPGLSDSVTETWKKRIRQLRVARVEDASMDKCGSSMNRHVIFNDGTTACARYRHPMAQFVLGDLYCYYLARMLDMQNVPTVVLSHVSNDSSSQWSSVTADIRNARWKNDTVASFSLWIDDIGKSDLPEIMYDNQRNTITPSTPGLSDLNITQLVELSQYSDLVIFDYITVHLDRMTIRKNAVEYYQQDWLYKGEVHNLAQHKHNQGLWFIDNENGIFNSYVVAYSKTNKGQMLGYHEELLHSFCLFRQSTFKSVHELARLDDPFQALDNLVHENEPVIVQMEQEKESLMSGVKERFKERLLNVVRWMDNCQSRFSG
ncbi:four-jointed box protein 1-like [Lytechinus variegatus]|uniref:four-jointed box protein 1-like n=1 Tax=Lytechinus variegatus TaxID=7654 RepID=UPI001BB0E58F|nr:four-jointed box protein 1-like [Lytechinus variegatus]XP_041471438.1 four-jointed box protein 1-like [Lytechinus variegatus]